MSAFVQVVAPGIGCSIQDCGRFGHRDIGVPLAGAADPVLLACANRLLGQDDNAAAIEMFLAGPCLLSAGASLRVALAGNVSGRLKRAAGPTTELQAWRSATLFPGDSLTVGAVRSGLAYLALSGGCLVPRQLGSRSTYARAALGGLNGMALGTGDVLPCSALSGKPWAQFQAAAGFAHHTGPVRVILGPQDDHFTPEAFDALLGQEYTVSREADRMGMRLQGPALAHRPDKGADIISEGVAPGAIQVPGNGQPIVLGVDAQTVGGYAKIATVIQADQPRLAHLRPGSPLRFAAVTLAQALSARRALNLSLLQWTASIAALLDAATPDAQTLYSANLVSGMIDAVPVGPIHLPWETE